MYASKRTVTKAQRAKMSKTSTKKFIMLASNIAQIGVCPKCNNPLVYYVKSEKKNIFNYYCVFCGRFEDVRNPSKNDSFINNENPLSIIKSLQENINKYIITEDDLKQPISDVVRPNENSK